MKYDLFLIHPQKFEVEAASEEEAIQKLKQSLNLYDGDHFTIEIAKEVQDNPTESQEG